MVGLDSYFRNLATQTGTQEFLVVRDDASMCESVQEFCSARRSMSMPDFGAFSSEISPAPKSQPKFQPEEMDFRPPTKPQRIGSHDDLKKISSGRRRFKEKKSTSVRRSSSYGHSLDSLFDTRAENRTDDKKNSLLSSDAPKFPIRKGSHDDLSTLATRRRAKHSQRDSKGDEGLVTLLDEVSTFLSKIPPAEKLKKRRNSDEFHGFYSYGLPLSEQELPEEVLLSPGTTRWGGRLVTG